MPPPFKNEHFIVPRVLLGYEEKEQSQPNSLLIMIRRERIWVAPDSFEVALLNRGRRVTTSPVLQQRKIYLSPTHKTGAIVSLCVCVCVHGISTIKRNQRRRRSHRPSADTQVRTGWILLLLLRGIVEQPLCLAFDAVVVSMKLQWQKRGENEEEKEDWEISKIEKNISNGTTTTTVKEKEKRNRFVVVVPAGRWFFSLQKQEVGFVHRSMISPHF